MQRACCARSIQRPSLRAGNTSGQETTLEPAGPPPASTSRGARGEVKPPALELDPAGSPPASTSRGVRVEVRPEFVQIKTKIPKENTICRRPDHGLNLSGFDVSSRWPAIHKGTTKHHTSFCSSPDHGLNLSGFDVSGVRLATPPPRSTSTISSNNNNHNNNHNHNLSSSKA